MINYSFFPADNRLSASIFSYGTMTLGEGITAPLVSPPNGLTGFVIKINCSNCEVVGKDFEGNAIAHQSSYVIGQTTFPIIGHAKGMMKYIIVFFHPLGMYQLFGVKMSAFTNKSIDLFDFLGHEKANNLIKRLVFDDSIEKQIDILNDFFLQQKPIQNENCIVKKALEMIHAAKGNITVNEIEKVCKTSRRSLERHFQEKVGLSPKVYAQVFRFKCMMNYLQENPKTSWTELSNIVGYFDQAHLIRYFKEYLKISPNNLVSLDVKFINYLLHY